MINALPATTVVRAVTVLIVLLCAALVAGSSPTEAGRLMAAQGTIIGVVNAVVLLLTWAPAFRLFHRVTFAHLWWFPLLDGRWQVNAWSNWPFIQALLASARGEAAPFNPLTDDLPGPAAPPVVMDAQIKSTLFGIEIVMTVPGTRRGSRTIFVRPQWCRPSLPTAHYVYRQEDPEPVAVTDSPEHLGAGVLQYHPESGELRGSYWTARQGARGLNTAGTIVLARKA